MDNTYRLQILQDAHQARVREFTEYQVNIDNYRAALAHVGDDPELQDFKSQLGNLLASSILEQKKCKVILDVVAQQLEVAHAV